MAKERGFGYLRSIGTALGGFVAGNIPEAGLAIIRGEASHVLTDTTIEELRKQNYLPLAVEAARTYVNHPPMSTEVKIVAGASLALEAIQAGTEEPAHNLAGHLWRVVRAGAVVFGPHAAILFASHVDLDNLPASLMDPEVVFYAVSAVLGNGRTIYNACKLGWNAINWPERRALRKIEERISEYRHETYLIQALHSDRVRQGNKSTE